MKTTNYPFLQALSDDTQQTAHLVLRTTDVPSGEFVQLLESVEQRAREIMPEEVGVSAQAGLHTVLKADKEIVDAQLGSLIVTLIAMFTTMLLLWRSWFLAAIALGISLGPLGLLAIIAAWFQVPLNSVTVMVGALALASASMTPCISSRTGYSSRDGALSRELPWVGHLKPKALPSSAPA